MKEKEFLEQLRENNFETIYLQPYWTIDDEGNVVIDEGCIREEFEGKIQELMGLAK